MDIESLYQYMTTKKVLELTDVIERAEMRMQDTTLYIYHEIRGTLSDYYTQFLQEAVMDLAIIPVERQFEGLEPEATDDPNDVAGTIKRVVSITAFLFHKSMGEVEQDLLRLMKEFPTADVREATALRYQNKLH